MITSLFISLNIIKCYFIFLKLLDTRGLNRTFLNGNNYMGRQLNLL